jgi:hypothetical protein
VISPKLIPAILLAVAALRAESICGLDHPNHSPNIDLLQVACVDYDALRAASPQYPWPAGKVTQVLLHVREGDAVRVTVDGVAKFADLSTDAWGRLVALVQFDGVEHAAVAVKVYRAVPE